MRIQDPVKDLRRSFDKNSFFGKEWLWLEENELFTIRKPISITFEVILLVIKSALEWYPE